MTMMSVGVMQSWDGFDRVCNGKHLSTGFGFARGSEEDMK